MRKGPSSHYSHNSVPQIGCRNLLARWLLVGGIVVGGLGLAVKGCVDTTRTLVANVMDSSQQES